VLLQNEFLLPRGMASAVGLGRSRAKGGWGGFGRNAMAQDSPHVFSFCLTGTA
jgi:hypothetical protein